MPSRLVSAPFGLGGLSFFLTKILFSYSMQMMLALFNNKYKKRTYERNEKLFAKQLDD